MNDHATYETAQRLSKVGFPASHPAPFNVWYCDGHPATLLEGLWRGNYSVGQPSEIVFAPTATDILKLMPDAALSFFTNKWVVIETATGDYLSECHDNPAEAAAEAWVARLLRFCV